MFIVKINDREYKLELSLNGTIKGKIDQKNFHLDVYEKSETELHVIEHGKSHNIEIISVNYEEKEAKIKLNGTLYTGKLYNEIDLLLKKLGMDQTSSKKIKELKAPMPGLVLNIAVKAGDEIKKGEVLIVLEAMKMENNLKAETDAIIKKIVCQQGQAVEKNEVLIIFE